MLNSIFLAHNQTTIECELLLLQHIPVIKLHSKTTASI